MTGVRAWLAAAVVAVAAFALYDATLLPGQDLGDSASFQESVGSPIVTARQAYPLYYATGALIVRAVGGEPARGLNLASALFAALACSLLAVAVSRLTASTVAGAVAGLLFAFSYTFWSQAITAEVYGLHAFMMGLSLVALLAWAARPTTLRLAAFFAAYAAGFGNHLMMVLLLPGFGLFLLLAAPGGWRSMLKARVLMLAVVIAALGACQYLWNVSSLLQAPDRPSGFGELVRTFWFEVTKADWRATMVMGIPESTLRSRSGMWWFDLRQQFGISGVALAALGLGSMFVPGQLPAPLARVARPRAGAALLVLLLACWLFAFTYNVGDAYVFFLPAHFFSALFAGVGAATLMKAASRLRPKAERRIAPALAVAVLALPAWHAWDNYPALDRSADVSARAFFDRLTNGLTGFNALLAAQLNWQLHNGLAYYGKYTRPDLAVLDAPRGLLYFPFVVNSNWAMGREVVVTDGARVIVDEAFGGLFRIDGDPRVAAPPLFERLSALAPDTPYVLTRLAPYPDLPVDAAEFVRSLNLLTGGTTRLPDAARYCVVAGRLGAPPTLVRSAMRPFRVKATVAGIDLDVRMESWLPSDTIRRMGFGRVVVGRRPVLTMDRGVSFVALEPDGAQRAVEYEWAILAPQPRWVIGHVVQ